MLEQSKSEILSVVKGILLAIIVNLIGVLLFALIIHIAILPTVVIKPVNQFIKLLSVFLGCFFFVRDGKGLIKGGIIGFATNVITYLAFALATSGISFGLGFLLDIVFGLIVGAISGILTVNVKK